MLKKTSFTTEVFNNAKSHYEFLKSLTNDPSVNNIPMFQEYLSLVDESKLGTVESLEPSKGEESKTIYHSVIGPVVKTVLTGGKETKYFGYSFCMPYETEYCDAVLMRVSDCRLDSGMHIITQKIADDPQTYRSDNYQVVRDFEHTIGEVQNPILNNEAHTEE